MITFHVPNFRAKFELQEKRLGDLIAAGKRAQNNGVLPTSFKFCVIEQAITLTKNHGLYLPQLYYTFLEATLKRKEELLF